MYIVYHKNIELSLWLQKLVKEKAVKKTTLIYTKFLGRAIKNRHNTSKSGEKMSLVSLKAGFHLRNFPNSTNFKSVNYRQLS